MIIKPKFGLNPALLLVSLMILFVMFGCEKEIDNIAVNAEITESDYDYARGRNENSADCFNFLFEGEAPIPLAPGVVIPAIPGTIDLIIGFGAPPTPVQIGEYHGYLSSAITETLTNVNSKGAARFRLVHYFTDGNGSSFWTNDMANCSPHDNDPFTCFVNDALTIVAGTGDFECARGQFTNKGLMYFAEIPGIGVVPVALEVKSKGRICGGCAD